MASQTPSIRLCKYCKRVPAYGTFDYCSRRCATAAAGAARPSSKDGSSSNATSTGLGTKIWDFLTSFEVVFPDDDPSFGGYQAMCKNCLSRPQNRPHEFCSKKCGQDYARAQRADRRSSVPLTSSPVSSPPRPNTYSRPSGTSAPFKPLPTSSRSVDGACCLMCRIVPKKQGSQFCGDSCENDAHKLAPLLLEVYNGDPKFNDIVKQFRSTWKDEGQIPPVIHVYKIVNSRKVENTYEQYKNAIEQRGNFSARGMAPGNENRRWHGTERKCNIGDSPNNLRPCNSSECCVCSILKSSYEVVRSTAGWFGKGIYTTATSSGSNEYVGRSPPGSNYRALFLNRVVVGNAYILDKQKESLKGPPKGYDSVIANANQSQGLAYDELVVYKNEAIRPSWLVIYG